MKALIVDDNFFNIKNISKLLEDLGVEVSSIMSGKECLENVVTNNYVIIFIDVMNPEVDGIEIMQNLKSIKEFNIPIIALTTAASIDDKEKYLSLGFDDYISKIIDINLLKEIIGKYKVEFKKLSLLEKRKLAIEDLIKYYSELRKYEYDNGYELKHIELRKKIHFLVSIILEIDQILSKEKIVVLNDLHNMDNDKPKIFACTHIGGNDVQRAFQVIKTSAYLMLGNPGILYKKIIYQGLRMNGVIPLETLDKKERKIAYNRAVELLNKNGNLLIFPEGAWNVSPNVFVMKLFTGTVRIAGDTGAEIIPIATEQYGDTFYFNIGKNYTVPENYLDIAQDLTDDLREKLATLKWEIMLSQPELKRDEIPKLEDFQDEIIGRCNYGYGFSLEDAFKERFHDKYAIEEEEVFAFLKNIDINLNNAFLMKDKLELSLRKKK